MISEKLVDRLHARAAQSLARKAQEGRKRALLTISRCVVVTTDDGAATAQHVFDRPPTIGELAHRVGPDAWVVSIAMRRIPRRERVALMQAAE